MNPLDHAAACLRCWEHEDCLEHPELALACGPGRDCPWIVMFVYEGEGGPGFGPDGDGWNPFGHGEGFGLNYGHRGGGGRGDAVWWADYGPLIPGDEMEELGP